MPMSNTRRAAITVLLASAFGGALFLALRGQKQELITQQETAATASTVPLVGVISLDVEAYFKDPRVQRLLAAKSMPVNVVRVGSREMAAKVVPAGSGTAAPDFLLISR